VGDPVLRLAHGSGGGIGKDHCRLREVDRLQLLLHQRGRRCLLVGSEALECPPIARARDILAGHRAQLVERRGGVILAEIGPHAVDAAVVHQVGFLEAALAGDDVVGGHDQRSRPVSEALRLRWRFFIGEDRRPGEEREADDGNGEQDPFQDVADAVDRRLAKVAVLHGGSPFELPNVHPSLIWVRPELQGCRGFRRR